MRIVMIDDNFERVQRAHDILGEIQGRVEGCGGIGEGVRLLLDGPADVILMDLHLPGLRGEATLPLLREVAPETPVIFLAEEIAPHEAQRLYRAGAFRVLQGRWDPERLVAAVQDATGQGPGRGRDGRMARRGGGGPPGRNGGDQP